VAHGLRSDWTALVAFFWPGPGDAGRRAESGDGSEVKWEAVETTHTTTLLLPGATRPAVRRAVEGWASTTTTHSQSTAIPLIWLRPQWSPRFRPNAMHRQYEVVQHVQVRCNANNGVLGLPIWVFRRIHAIYENLDSLMPVLECIKETGRCSYIQTTVYICTCLLSTLHTEAKLSYLRLMDLVHICRRGNVAWAITNHGYTWRRL
jgi:hypothetical protein